MPYKLVKIDEAKSLAESVIKMYPGMSGMEYAHQESWNVQTAANALSFIASMVADELGEPDDVQSLANIMRSLIEFINGEISDMVSGAKQGMEMYAKSAPAQVKEAEQTEEPEPNSELNLSYAKSIGDIDNASKRLAVKYVAKDQIKAYTFLWGDNSLTDVEIEYFTNKTDFWDDTIGKAARPLTWDHAQDEDFKASPVIGQITDFGDDDLGRWYVAKLDTAHRYRKMIDALIEQGVIGTSSDSAPQYIIRQKTGKATWLKQWPWFASALTNTPCEPRMIDSIEFLKSLGISIPDVLEGWEAETAILDYFKIKYL